MADAVTVIALLFGGALGTVFFGGLWWTVRRGMVSQVPARWFLGSLLLRTVLVVAGFLLIGSGQPVRLGLCLLGFLLARSIILRAARANPASPMSPASGAPPCA